MEKYQPLRDLHEEEIIARSITLDNLHLFKNLHEKGFDVLGAQIRYCMCGQCDVTGNLLYEALCCVFDTGSILVQYVGYEDDEDEIGLYEIKIQENLADGRALDGLPTILCEENNCPMIVSSEVNKGKYYFFTVYDYIWGIYELIEKFFAPLRLKELELAKEATAA